ncbi:MAG TPA: hypothetical protein VF039_13360 [Longimicrobiales bacterium]
MRRPLAALAVATLVAACDTAPDSAAIPADTVTTDTGGAQAAAGPKACDLVSNAELEEILGVDLDGGRTTNDYAGDSKCQWDLAGDAPHGVSLSLRVLDDLQIYRDVPGGINAPNVGEEAIWNPTYGQLAVLQRGRVVSIALLIDEPQREDAEAIARLALERLGG